jgi:N-methylhydantoinase A
MTPLFACTIAAQAGIDRVVVPPHSAAFSAWGVVMADRVRRYARTVSWNLEDIGRADAVNAVATTLIGQALTDAQSVGLDPAELQIRRLGAFRFMGQVWEIDLPLDDRALTAEDAAVLRERFVERYEEIYGTGTAWRGSPVVLLDYEILATVEDSSSPFHRREMGSAKPPARAVREVFNPATRATMEVPIFDNAVVGTGARIEGPALIDAEDTTILIPEAFVGERDGWGNLLLSVR